MKVIATKITQFVDVEESFDVENVVNDDDDVDDDNCNEYHYSIKS